MCNEWYQQLAGEKKKMAVKQKVVHGVLSSMTELQPARALSLWAATSGQSSLLRHMSACTSQREAPWHCRRVLLTSRRSCTATRNRRTTLQSFALSHKTGGNPDQDTIDMRWERGRTLCVQHLTLKSVCFPEITNCTVWEILLCTVKVLWGRYTCS